MTVDGNTFLLLIANPQSTLQTCYFLHQSDERSISSGICNIFDVIEICFIWWPSANLDQQAWVNRTTQWWKADVALRRWGCVRLNLRFYLLSWLIQLVLMARRVSVESIMKSVLFLFLTPSDNWFMNIFPLSTHNAHWSSLSVGREHFVKEE